MQATVNGSAPEVDVPPITEVNYRPLPDDGLITIRGYEFWCQPLNFDNLIYFLPLWEKMKGMKTTEALEVMRDVTLAALQQSYPDLNKDKLGKILNFRNIKDVADRVMEIAGLKKSPETEMETTPTGT